MHVMQPALLRLGALRWLSSMAGMHSQQAGLRLRVRQPEQFCTCTGLCSAARRMSVCQLYDIPGRASAEGAWPASMAEEGAGKAAASCCLSLSSVAYGNQLRTGDLCASAGVSLPAFERACISSKLHLASSYLVTRHTADCSRFRLSQQQHACGCSVAYGKQPWAGDVCTVQVSANLPACSSRACSIRGQHLASRACSQVTKVTQLISSLSGLQSLHSSTARVPLDWRKVSS